MLNEDHELEVQPEEIVEWRESHNGQVEVLVKWQQLPSCNNTWELAADVQDTFPHFPLEDKVVLLGGVLIDFNRNLLLLRYIGGATKGKIMIIVSQTVLGYLFYHYLF